MNRQGRRGGEAKLSVEDQLLVAFKGLLNVMSGTCTPTKKPRKQPLPQEEKPHNRALARLRVRVEHVIRRLRFFACFQDVTAIVESGLAYA
jgi:hypothetical protein